MAYKVQDKYFKKAKEEGFAARSVYKLQDIDQKFKLIKTGQVIADFGCSPGSWSQWLSQKVGPQGKVIGWDLTEVPLKLPNVIFFQEDMLKINLPSFLEQNQLPTLMDGVVSDMAPKTTGIRDVDQARSHELCDMALQLALQVLKPKGFFVCKYFQSGEFNKFRDQLKKHFQRVEVVKPPATRTHSYEIFLVGINFGKN